MRDLHMDGDEGRFYGGNLHRHSSGPDVLLGPRTVSNAYRDAVYDVV